MQPTQIPNADSSDAKTAMTPSRMLAAGCASSRYQTSVAVTVKTAPIVCANRLAAPGAYRGRTARRGVTSLVAIWPRGLSVGPVSARATNPYASTGSSHPCWNAIATTARTATPAATVLAEVSLTGFGNEKSSLMTTRKSGYRSLASLQRDTARCRACVEAGFPLESLPVRAPFPALSRPGVGGSADDTSSRYQRAYLYGQAPGIVEGQERLPWRGRAGQTLRRWLQLDEDTFYATFYCASVTRCYPGRAASGRGDRTPAPREQELCQFWRDWELELLRPRLIVTVGGLALKRLLGLPGLSDCIGCRFEHDGIPVVPLPHPSGASSWPNVPANRSKLDAALALVHAELDRTASLA